MNYYKNTNLPIKMNYVTPTTYPLNELNSHKNPIKVYK